jgi:trehalose/maltose hydrolase-like predicted phosphorylase
MKCRIIFAELLILTSCGQLSAIHGNESFQKQDNIPVEDGKPVAAKLAVQGGAAIAQRQGRFGPGRLDETYLAQPGEPWILETRAPDAPGHRDAFLGNGWMGQRLGVEGDASTYSQEPPGGPMSPSGCLIQGLWDDRGLITPPLWAVLDYNDGEHLLRRGVGIWQNYRQRLDLRTGTLTTEVDWNSGVRASRLVTRVWLSRSRPGVAVLEREVTPSFDGEVSFIDRLDGRVAGEARTWRAQGSEQPDQTISLDARFGPRERWLALLSRLVIEGAAPTVAVSREERMVERTVRLKVRAGQTARVVKVVAVATDADSGSPGTTAWNLAEGAARGLGKLRADHEAAWAALWSSRIEVGHPGLQRLLDASLFQLYCNVREGSPWVPGPTGLSANAWGGHVFWDDDLWMFPGLCLLRPELGRCFVEYRCRTLPGAFRNARAEGYDGAMIAWESTEFGDDMIPQLVYHHQHHVNSDVALAQWWYALIAGDEPFLREKGLPVILACARFWTSRVVYNSVRDRYELRRICGADEHAEIQDNNAYTNYSAAWTLRLAARLARRFGLECPPDWERIADKLWVPFDEEHQRYLEFEGYTGGKVKQADTALLIYPYEMPMPDTVKANTVDYYRKRYPEGNIMMAAAFDGIVDCELGRPVQGWASLLRLLPHFRTPYLLASESPKNECMSFCTGLGGLMQLVLMGYAGVRVREDGLVAQPCVPAEVGDLTVRGLHYGGVSFDLLIRGGKATVAHASAPFRFSLRDRAGTAIPIVK